MVASFAHNSRHLSQQNADTAQFALLQKLRTRMGWRKELEAEQDETQHPSRSIFPNGSGVPWNWRHEHLTPFVSTAFFFSEACMHIIGKPSNHCNIFRANEAFSHKA